MPPPARNPSDSDSLDDTAWLCSPAAQPWLDTAAQAEGALTAQVARLRHDLSAERTHLVLELVRLRQKGLAKFADAGRMFFTAQGLEQATDEVVAAYKAARFGAGRVADLCCGIGGDLRALARRGAALGLDRDPVMATLAAANLRELPTGTVEVLDVAEWDPQECDAWHIDPDRRPRGRRTTLVELHEPGPQFIERLLARNNNAAIKLAPAAELPETWNAQAELEWIGRDRECKQLVAWFGGLATGQGGRRATVLGATADNVRTIVGQGDEPAPEVATIGRYVFEPHAAVLAAKLGGALAAEHGLSAITAGIAYWTGDTAVSDPALGCFEVQEVMPLRIKPLKALLKARGIGQLEIKKRGVEHDPAELRKQLALRGDASAVLLVTRIGKSVTAILAQRVDGN